MQAINCPNCATKINAENINIQEKIAVCPNCATVFKFDLPEAKVKRRKLKQPRQITLVDAETLQLRFRTNFVLGRDSTFVNSTIWGLLMSFLSVIFWSQFSAGEVGLAFPIGFTLIALLLFYVMGLRVFNHTELEMDADTIRLSRKPLPSLVNQVEEFQLSGFVGFHAEESAKSLKEAYDTPRFHVWAERQDGTRKIVLTDLIEDYAYFVAQVLDERLKSEDNLDVSRLEDAAEDSQIREISAEKSAFSKR